jgi:hypothetical protein
MIEDVNSKEVKEWGISQVQNKDLEKNRRNYVMDKVEYSKTNNNKVLNTNTVILSRSTGEAKVATTKAVRKTFETPWNCYDEDYTQIVGDWSSKNVQQTYFPNDWAYFDHKLTATFNYHFVYDKQTPTWKYIGQFGDKNPKCIEIAKTKEDLAPLKNPYLMCLYIVNDEFLHFSDYSYLNWYYIATSMCATDMIIKEIHRYVINQPDMIAMNKFYCKYATDVRKMAANGNYFYYNIPLSSMIIKVPNSQVVPNKYYIPGVKINTWQAVNIDSVNGVNANAYTKLQLTHEGCNNYMDLVMDGLVDGAFHRDSFDDSVVFCVLLPSRGSQLFETIDKSIVSLLPSSAAVIKCRYSDSKSILYNMGQAKIVFSPIDFNSNSTTKVLLNNYKHVGTVCAPKIVVKKNTATNEYIWTLNAKNNDGTSCYVYVSKDSTQELVANADNKTVNRVVNKNINISYNGIDANKTPTCLLKHFV